METLGGRLALRALARGSDVTCLDVAGAVQVLLGFLVQAGPLLQSGEVTEIIDGLGGFRAVMVIDCDSSGEHFDGLSVPAGCRQDAICSQPKTAAAVSPAAKVSSASPPSSASGG